MRFATHNPGVGRRNLLLESIKKIRRRIFHNEFGLIFNRDQIFEMALAQQFAAMQNANAIANFPRAIFPEGD